MESNLTDNQIGTTVIDAAIRLHRGLGPGLLESVYEAVLAKQLATKGLEVRRQVPVSFEFEGISFDEGFRVDLLINTRVVLELKSVAQISPVHKKQLLTYLRLMNLNLGYLLNFGEVLMKDGITRVVNGEVH